MALKTHMLTHSHALGPWELVSNALETIPEVVNWVYFLPNSFLVVTEMEPRELSVRLQEVLADKTSSFIVVNLGNEATARDLFAGRAHFWGLLPRAQWDVIRRPHPVEPPAPAAPAKRLIKKRPRPKS